MSLTFDNTPARPAWPEQGLAAGIALALHVGLGLVLFNLSSGEPLPPVLPAVIKTQLLTLPTASAPQSQPEPLLAAAPVPTPSVPEPLPKPAPQPAPKPAPKPTQQARPAPPPEKADLAFKRAEQQRKEQALLAERAEQQRQRDEARQLHERQIQERQVQQQAQLAQQAEARRQAATAAAAKAAADAEQAASRQYQPIDKQAPAYPQTALDRRIEGECTVAYSVNPQGRVEDPHVVGTCHPLFIKPSLAAAKTFRYQPKIINGQAVAVAEVKNTFTYKIR